MFIQKQIRNFSVKDKNNIDIFDIVPNLKSGGKMVVIPVMLKGDNVFIVKDKNVILFDTGTKKDIGIISKTFKDNGLKMTDISLIVVSHSHYHNVGNLNYFKSVTKAPILIHHLEADNLISGEPYLNRIDNFDGFLASFAKRSINFEPVKSDLEYSTDFDLTPYGVKGKVIHTPGHTSGYSSLFLANNQVICGEVIIKKMYSRHLSFPYFIDNKKELRKSYLKIMESSPTEIYSSHGGKISFELVKKSQHKLIK